MGCYLRVARMISTPARMMMPKSPAANMSIACGLLMSGMKFLPVILTVKLSVFSPCSTTTLNSSIFPLLLGQRQSARLIVPLLLPEISMDPGSAVQRPCGMSSVNSLVVVQRLRMLMVRSLLFPPTGQKGLLATVPATG